MSSTTAIKTTCQHQRAFCVPEEEKVTFTRNRSSFAISSAPSRFKAATRVLE
ncbi:MAG: hypothetical protein IGS48_20505 [Oscillatoriales cyanobacterium C42_A2020_001]|nr:hypothetical protein [Leptolyngbyaceae cyanobacterium C42_A2020_001]